MERPIFHLRWEREALYRRSSCVSLHHFLGRRSTAPSREHGGVGYSVVRVYHCIISSEDGVRLTPCEHGGVISGIQTQSVVRVHHRIVSSEDGVRLPPVNMMAGSVIEDRRTHTQSSHPVDCTWG